VLFLHKFNQMSRYSCKRENRRLNYGCDHALGYWYDIVEIQGKNEKMITEESSIFGMSRSKFIEVLTEWNVKESHLQAVALDITF
jgi:hypothetical protein